jgi:hypothetical protein
MEVADTLMNSFCVGWVDAVSPELLSSTKLCPTSTMDLPQELIVLCDFAGIASGLVK